MTHILTFVAGRKQPLSKKHLKEAIKVISYYDVKTTDSPRWLAKDKAAEFSISAPASGILLMHLREMLGEDKIDLFSTPANNRRKKLLLADMDSTIVTGETLDDLAEHAGIKHQIAAITQKAMEGKLDFHAALRERVSLLKGLEESALHDTLKKIQLSPGAKEFVSTMKAHGATCVLVSGGFTFFTQAIAQQAGFDHHHGNILEVKNGELAGTVTEPILDKHAKVHFLEHYAQTLGIGFDESLTIGDGANDIPMLKKAGLGIGYQPKPVVADAVSNIIVHGDLTAALYAQGYTDKDIRV